MLSLHDSIGASQGCGVRGDNPTTPSLEVRLNKLSPAGLLSFAELCGQNTSFDQTIMLQATSLLQLECHCSNVLRWGEQLDKAIKLSKHRWQSQHLNSLAKRSAICADFWAAGQSPKNIRWSSFQRQTTTRLLGKHPQNPCSLIH